HRRDAHRRVEHFRRSALGPRMPLPLHLRHARLRLCHTCLIEHTIRHLTISLERIPVTGRPLLTTSPQLSVSLLGVAQRSNPHGICRKENTTTQLFREPQQQGKCSSQHTTLPSAKATTWP